MRNNKTMDINFYFKRLREEKLSPKFIFSRVIFRSGLFLPVKLNLDKEMNGKIYLHPSSIPHDIFVKGSNQDLIIAICRTFIKENDTVFDVGANVGVFSILFSNFCKKGKIFSFEPTKKIFRFLLENIELNKINNIFAINFAISNINGVVSFFENKYSDDLNYIDNRELKNSASVLSIRLNSFMEIFGLEKIDFLKIDTEGAELLVLNSMKDKLKKTRVIYFEFNGDNYSKFNYDKKDVIELLKLNNFNIFIPQIKENQLKLIPFKMENINDDMESDNLLAINRDYIL